MAKDNVLHTVLLLALPASGKSEVRRYLAQLSPKECGEDFHMGPTLQLDDYPYVHLMRCIDDELAALGKSRVFFKAGDKPFQDGRHWGTLIQLLNEDYANMHAKKNFQVKSAGLYIMERIDAAAKKVGANHLAGLDVETRKVVANKIEKDSRKLVDELNDTFGQDLKGKTIVMECARGGAHGSTLPLSGPFGYQYSLPQLSPEILKNASILYVWVTPEESRRKNQERTDPNDPGSILNHGVPIDVMMGDYGVDDMTWLEEHSEKPGTITVKSGGTTYYLPIARFDNRSDKTTFIRNDRKAWKPEQVKAVHDGLKNALTKLANYK